MVIEKRSTFSGVVSGRATAGSRLQLQAYVNQHPDLLSNAILNILPQGLRDLNANLRWVSPLEQDNYCEYSDSDFLRVLGLDEGVFALEQFWPRGGPSWDALARISDTNGRMRQGAILVEAKSHVSEIYGNGCQACGESRALITKSLSEAQRWCDVQGDHDWLGPLYQSANRIAHLFFIRERLKILRCPAWLINIYFLNDPIGPADRRTWEREIEIVKTSLGLTRSIPFAFDVFLPSLS